MRRRHPRGGSFMGGMIGGGIGGLLCNFSTYFNGTGTIKENFVTKAPLRMDGDELAHTGSNNDLKSNSWVSTLESTITFSDLSMNDRYVRHLSSTDSNTLFSVSFSSLSGEVRVFLRSSSSSIFYDESFDITESFIDNIVVEFDQPTSTITVTVDGVELDSSVVSISGNFTINEYAIGYAGSSSIQHATMLLSSYELTGIGSTDFVSNQSDGLTFTSTTGAVWTLTEDVAGSSQYPGVGYTWSPESLSIEPKTGDIGTPLIGIRDPITGEFYSTTDTEVHLWRPEYQVGTELIYVLTQSSTDTDKGSIFLLSNIYRGSAYVDDTHCLAQVATGKIRTAEYFDIADAQRVGCAVSTITTAGFEHQYLNYFSDGGTADWVVSSSASGMTIAQLHVFSNSGNQGVIELYNWDGATETLLGSIDLTVQTHTASSVVYEVILSQAVTVGDDIRIKRNGLGIRIQTIILLHATNIPVSGENRGILVESGWVSELGVDGDGRSGAPYLAVTSAGIGGGSTITSALRLAQSGDTPVFIGGMAHQDFSVTNGGWINPTSDLVVSKGYSITQDVVKFNMTRDLSDDGIVTLGSEEIEYVLTSNGITWDSIITLEADVDTGTSYVNMMPFNESKPILTYNDGVFDYTSESGTVVRDEPEWIHNGEIRIDLVVTPALDVFSTIANTNGMNKQYPEIVLPSTTVGGEEIVFKSVITDGIRTSKLISDTQCPDNDLQIIDGIAQSINGVFQHIP